jgi:anti-sigma regulatory factor (Ser/Thr protein kinase)
MSAQVPPPLGSIEARRSRIRGGANRSRSVWLAAIVTVAAPFVVAVVSGVFGYRELRDALTFDVRGLQALTLRTALLRLDGDEEAAVDQDAATHAGAALDRYRTDERQRSAIFGELTTASDDLLGAEGRRFAERLTTLHERWTTETARPLLSGQPQTRALVASARRGRVLLTVYRDELRVMGRSIRERIVAHQRSSAGELSRIALFFVASSATCALGISLGVWQFMRLESARAKVESALHEHEILSQRDRSWSRSFQRAVLPPGLPTVTGCRLDAVYEPGANDRHVGGDWYDAVQLIDGRLVISIGDVAGSGVEAAVVMGVARQIMRGIAQVHPDPGLMLDAADRALRIEHGDVFVTAWVGVIDLVTRTLTYSSAGHPPALLCAPSGTLVELRDAALPLGLRHGHAGRSTTIELADGATLFLYTDGLSEATRDVLAGERLVRTAVTSVAREPWREPAVEVARRVLTNGSSDDVAVLVARLDFRAAEGSIHRLRFDARDAAAARRARDEFVHILTARDFDAAATINAELIFGELVGNVVRHVALPQVEIAIDCNGPQTVLHVFDRGAGFRHNSRLPADLYSESGRGLFIISSLTEEFTVSERVGGGSHMRVALAGGNSPWLATRVAARSVEA